MKELYCKKCELHFAEVPDDYKEKPAQKGHKAGSFCGACGTKLIVRPFDTEAHKIKRQLDILIKTAKNGDKFYDTG